MGIMDILPGERGEKRAQVLKKERPVPDLEHLTKEWVPVEDRHWTFAKTGTELHGLNERPVLFVFRNGARHCLTRIKGARFQGLFG